MDSFDEFWPEYVGAHRSPTTRAFHYVGTTLSIGTVSAAVLTLNPLWLLATPVVGYGPAWVSHFFIEGNRPATFEHPIWSLKADLKMLGLALRGEMANEVTRLYGSAHPAPDAPRVDIPAATRDESTHAGKAHEGAIDGATSAAAAPEGAAPAPHVNGAPQAQMS